MVEFDIYIDDKENLVIVIDDLLIIANEYAWNVNSNLSLVERITELTGKPGFRPKDPNVKVTIAKDALFTSGEDL